MKLGGSGAKVSLGFVLKTGAVSLVAVKGSKKGKKTEMKKVTARSDLRPN